MKIRAYRIFGLFFMVAETMVCLCSNHMMMVDAPNDHRHACDMSTTDAINDCNECLADKVLDVSVDIGAVVWVSLDVVFNAKIDKLLVVLRGGSVHPPPALHAIKMNC